MTWYGDLGRVDVGPGHAHDYQPWRQAPGSAVTGHVCPACGDLRVDP